MIDEHLTCHTLLLRQNPDKGKVLFLPDPLKPIPRETISIGYQPDGSIAN
jgi:hypothetical protein